jgi:hypothetical protein
LEGREVDDRRVKTNIEFPRCDLTEAKWLVSVVATILEVSAIFQLLFSGETEELFADCELVVNLFLAESEIDDVKEAFMLLSTVITCC